MPEPAAAQPPDRQGARINNLKVLSDKIDDVTTPENILKSFIKPGMSDADRAKALWTAAVKYRHQTAPPNEYLSTDWEAHDPVKLFNVYGYCMCCCCSSLIESLNRLDGREARGRILTGHSVPEVRYGDAWHMYDCSLITLFPKPDDGKIAAVDDISAAVKGWYAKNPGFRGNQGKLVELMRKDGWMGWKADGPALLANAPYLRTGYYPARTHGWDATMVEYDRDSEVYEYGYQVGHRALFSLRPGESFVREAGNRGLHVNMAGDPKAGILQQKAPNDDLVYLKEFMPGYNGGVVANGYQRYTPALASGGLANGAAIYENLTSGGTPALRVKNPKSGAGMAVIEMNSPYVYLGGRVKVRAVKGSSTDRIELSLSTNNGRTWQPLWSAQTAGVNEATVELKDRVMRRYAYQLKVSITSASTAGTGLDQLSIENDIQHAPRTLPWLGKGKNTITVASDTDTGLSTRTVTCMITPKTDFRLNESSTTMGLVFDNLDVREGSCWWKGGTGSMTVPIETPGEMTALRFGAQIRARGEKDLIKVLLSFDGGKTWQEAGKIAGPTPGTTRYFRFDSVPKGAKGALLKYEMTGNNTVGVFSFRVDADYKDPLAAKSIRPFTVTHQWKEGGEAKSKQVQVTKLPFSYEIETAAEPEMVSVSYAMPTQGASPTVRRQP
jgi:hypothetical protein